MLEVVYTATALKALKRIAKADAVSIMTKIDAHAVDLPTGTVKLPVASVLAGNGSDGLQFSRDLENTNFRDEINGSIRLGTTTAQTIVSIAGSAEAFTLSGGIFTSAEATGSTLVKNGDLYTYIKADSSIAIYDQQLAFKHTISDLTKPARSLKSLIVCCLAPTVSGLNILR